MTTFEDAVSALRRINEAVSDFDDAVKGPAVDVLLPLVVEVAPRLQGRAVPAVSPPGATGDSWTPGQAADFYDAIEPRREPDRALVVAYYLIRVEGQPDVGAGEVNDTLRAIGQGINNIGRAMTQNVTERRLMQTGTSKRGKRYGLTARGARAVEGWLASEQGST